MKKKEREIISDALVETYAAVQNAGSMENAVNNAREHIMEIRRNIDKDDITDEEIVLLSVIGAGHNTIQSIRNYLGSSNFFKFPELNGIVNDLKLKWMVFFWSEGKISITSCFNQWFVDETCSTLSPKLSKVTTLRRLFDMFYKQMDIFHEEEAFDSMCTHMIMGYECDGELKTFINHCVQDEDHINVRTLLYLTYTAFRPGNQTYEVNVVETIRQAKDILLEPGITDSKVFNEWFIPKCENGMASSDTYEPSRAFYKAFPSLNCQQTDVDLARSNVMAAKSIPQVELYFDDETQSQYDRISFILSDEGYSKITTRLSSKNMSTGITMLFYGPPGTGKTESAKQMARASGRDLIILDLSSLRDKYVGETEKNAAAAFQEYRELCITSAKKPILLLNEADAVLGRRNGQSETSVDKMETAMTNIFLNELENFSGIMVATTNLTSLFDTAFERRFLFKMKFNRPTDTARLKMWMSKIESVSPEELGGISKKYDFTGAEIDNVCKKVLIESLFSDNPQITVEELDKICSMERIHDGNERKKVCGFSN